jgi:hypothetical protein
MQRKRVLMTAGSLLLLVVLVTAATVQAKDPAPEACWFWQCNTTSYVGEFDNTGTGGAIAGYAYGDRSSYGWNSSASGQGVRGWNNNEGYGVYGRSYAGIGVRGEQNDGYGFGGYFTGFDAVRGIAEGDPDGYGGWFSSYTEDGRGVYGYASGTSSYAVYGNSPGYIGVYGTGDNYGGYFTGFDGARGVTSADGGYGGWFSAYGDDGHGVHAYSSGASSWAGYFINTTYRGIYADGAPGWYDGYFPQAIFVGGWSMGAYGSGVTVLNAGSEALQPGDLVALQGFDAAALDAGQPALSVVKANGGSIMGVVQGAYVVEAPAATPDRPEVLPAANHRADTAAVPPAGTEGEHPSTWVNAETGEILLEAPQVLEGASPEPEAGRFVEGAVQPGQLAIISVEGFVRVNLSASRPIKAGEYVALSSNGSAVGLAASGAGKALDRGYVVIGRALEDLNGKGSIYVSIDLR